MFSLSNRAMSYQSLSASGRAPCAIGSDSHCGEVDCVTNIGPVSAVIQSVEMRGYRWAAVRCSNQAFVDYVADQCNDGAGLTKASSLVAFKDFEQSIPRLVSEFLATQTVTEAA